ncbi:hypothetical protein E4K72_01705 [Oxalobacteraceae bacterium OM1]|nr:hypothetical protein E4K72_01705 [Oxalobacteraceae bacterium OM1]
MAEPVTMSFNQLRVRTALACALFLSCGSVFAEALADPTAPPSPMRAAPTGTTAGSDAKPVLQSVVIGKDHSMAIIDGVAVGLGEPFRNAKVVRISESEVALKSESRIETLKLYQGIEKRPSAQRPNAPVGRSDERKK